MVGLVNGGFGTGGAHPRPPDPPHLRGGAAGVGLDESGRLFALIRCGCVSGFVMGVQYHFPKTQLALVPKVDKPIP